MGVSKKKNKVPEVPQMDALRWNVLLKWMKALGHPWQRIMAAQEGSVPEDATVSCRHPRRLGDIRGTLFKGYPHETYRKHHGKNETSRNQTCSSNVLLGTPTKNHGTESIYDVYIVL